MDKREIPGLWMITCNNDFRALLLAAALLVSTACDGGSPSRTPDDIAADSALAADLALANRDTLVVDSIGAYRSPDAAERDAVLDTTVTPDIPAEEIEASATNPVVRDAVPQSTGAGAGTPGASRPTSVTPAPTVASRAAPATPARAPVAVTRLRGTRACASPTLANQSECVKVTLAATDMRLNRIYRALMTEMRRQEGVARGAKDPPSVQRLRVSQRSWLVYRDNECRRRGRGKEGALWARPRVRCLGQFSVRRANELADNFSRLTAH